MTDSKSVGGDTVCGSTSHHRHHVGASFVSLAPTFLQKSERAHAAAPPFQIEPAALGFDLVLGASLEAAGIYTAVISQKSTSSVSGLSIFHLFTLLFTRKAMKSLVQPFCHKVSPLEANDYRLPFSALLTEIKLL